MPTSFENSTYFICHYGVKGQKKGLRRYQEEDGSYTSLGRQHYGIGDPRQEGTAQQPPPTRGERFRNATFERFREGSKNAYNKAKSSIRRNYKEIRNGDAEKGRKIAENGGTKGAIVGQAILRNVGAKWITNWTSSLVAGPNGKSLLSSAVRMAGNAFILKNTLDSVKAYRNLSEYKKTQKR